MNYYYYTIFIILFYACASPQTTTDQEDNNQSQLIISGKVLNYSSENNVNHIQLYGDQKYIETLQEDGSFRFKISFQKTKDIKLYYKFPVTFLAHPSDEIYIEFDGNINQETEFLHSITFEGDAAVSNEDFVDYFIKKRMSESLFEIPSTNKSEEVYLDELVKIHDAREKLIESFVAYHAPSEEVVYWISLDLAYHSYLDLLAYPELHKAHSSTSNERYDMIHTSFLHQFHPIEREDLVYSNLSKLTKKYLHAFVYPKVNSLSVKNKEEQLIQEIIGMSDSKGLFKALLLKEIIDKEFLSKHSSIYENHRLKIEYVFANALMENALDESFVEIKQ